MNQEQLESLAVELAGMEQECKYHPAPQVDDSDPTRRICSCHGTGKVFLFPDSVRVPCKSQGYITEEDVPIVWKNPKRHPKICKCAGRGWMPPLDRRVWEPAFSLAGAYVEVVWWRGSGKADARVESEPMALWNVEAERLLTALLERGKAVVKA